MTTFTSTTTLTFQANDQSLWGPDTGISISRLFENLVFHTSLGTISGQKTFSLPLGNSAGIDYSLSVPNLEFGFPIQASLSSGVFDLNYPAIANLSLPGTVAAGTNFTVATGFGGVVAPTLVIDGPSAELSVDAILRASIEGRLGVTWDPVIGSAGSHYFFGSAGTTDTVTIDKSYSIFDLNTSGGASLGDLVGWSSTNAAGRTTYSSPVGSISYYLDTNGLDGAGQARLGTDQLTDFSAVLYQSTPMVSLSLDIDDTIGALLAATPAGPIISGLDQELSNAFLSLEASVLSLNTSIGVSLAQRVTFDAQALKVTLASSTGETHSGKLGDSFTFTAPSTAGTPLSVTASYALEGVVKVETGLVVTGSVDIHGLGVQGDILGFEMPALFPDGAGDPDTDPDHFLINYRPNDFVLGEFFLPTASSHAVTFTLPASVPYAIPFGTTTDPVGALPSAQPFDFPLGAVDANGRRNATAALDGDGYYVVSTGDFGDYSNNDSLNDYHLGEDWNAESAPDADLGAPVHAIADGEVVFAGDGGTGWGGVVIVKHTLADGTNGGFVTSLYGHLSGLLVTTGQTVVRGADLGLVMNAGTGPHLHFEIRSGTNPLAEQVGHGYSPAPEPAGWLDPTDFIRARRGQAALPGNQPAWTLTPASTTVSEGAGTADFVLTRSDATLPQTVYVSTTVNQGSYNAGDYSYWKNQPLTFAAGQASRPINIAITDDATAEGTEAFGLIVQQNADDPFWTRLAQGTFAIIDNDTGSPNPGSGETYSGTNESDNYSGTNKNDAAFGYLGDDSLSGEAGNDTLNGGDGNDALFGGEGDDYLVDTGNGNDYLIGGPGDDTITSGGDGKNSVFGGEGNDQIDILGARFVYAGSFAAHLVTVTSEVDGGGGNDHVVVGRGTGAPGNAVLNGGAGFDEVTFDLSGDTNARLLWDLGRDGRFNQDLGLFESKAASGGTIRAYTGYMDDNYITSWVDLTSFEAINYIGGPHGDTFLGNEDFRVLSARGGEGVDTLIADWSHESAGIDWNLSVDNEAEKTLANGVVVQSIERVVLRTGAGDDSLALGSQGGSLETGEGNDQIDIRSTNFVNAGSFPTHLVTVTSEVDGGGGNDHVVVGRGTGAPGNAVLNGGAGFDEVTFDLSGDTNARLLWDLGRDGRFNQDLGLFESKAASGGTIRAYTGYMDDNYITSWVDLTSFEAINYIGGPHGDTFLGNEDFRVLSARGGEGVDTLIADWSHEPAGIDWNLSVDNEAEKTLANGVVVQSIERVVLRTGAGDDHLALGNHGGSLETGEGNDELQGSGGDDILDGGDGDDTVSVNGNGAAVIDDGADADTVYGFIAGASGNARLDLSRLLSIRTLTDVLFHGAQQGSDTMLDFGGGDTLRLVGVSMASLDAGDFIFNDDAVLSIKATSASKPEGYSGTTPFTFTVTRSGTLSTSATAKWAVNGGGAAGTVPATANDFLGSTLPSGLVSFAPGETSKALSIAIAGDKAVELNESFTVTLSNPSADVALDVASATGVMFNDDIIGTGTLSIAAASASRPEGTGGTAPFTFTVTRSGSTTGPAQAKWTVTGGGVAGANPAIAADFAGNTFPSGLVSFAAGQTSRTITIPVNGDTVIEPADGFTVTLSEAPDGVTFGITTATGTIANDDATLSIAAASASKPEGSGAVATAYTFTVTRSGDLSQSHTAKWSVTGSGAQPADAQDFQGGVLPSGTVSFAPGQATYIINVLAAADRLVEANEGFTVTLAAPSGGATLGTTTAIGTIANDDSPGTGTLSVARLQAGRAEGQSGSTAFTFLATRTGATTGSAVADWAVSPGSSPGTTPANASDFTGGVLPSGIVSFAPGEASRTITINVTGDAANEFNESFLLALANVPTGVSLGTASAVGIIYNDDTPGTGSLSIARGNAQLAEGNAGSTGFTFTVIRGGDTTGTASADWAVTAGAVASTVPANGADFVGGVFPSGRVNFAAGQAQATVTVLVAGDGTIELNDGFAITLAAPQAGVTIGTATVTGVILNDDFPPSGVLSVAPLQAVRGEGAGGSTAFTFAVTRGGSTTGPANANWAVGGGTATGDDFVGGAVPSGIVSFAPGETSKVVTVAVAGDAQVEADETFGVTLSGVPAGVTLGTATSQGVIVNDDPGGTGNLSIARASAQKAEGHTGSTPFTFTVTRSGDLSGVAGADWAVTGGTASGTVAANGADFVGGQLPSGRVSFAAGEATRTVQVAVASDVTVELNESFTVTLANAQAGVAVGTASAVGMILNDDFASTAANQALTGTDAPDLFLLGGGLDTVLGKGGTDLFRFQPAAVGPAVGNATTLQDFSRTVGEVIDLSAIDAIAGTLVNDAFSFIGTAAFSAAGQLRWQDQGATRLIQAEVTGDGIADVTIIATAAGPVDGNWFVL